MAGRSGEFDAVAAEVEVDVARGVELHFDRCVAAGRHLPQFERTAEGRHDLLAYGGGIEGHPIHARCEAEPFARGRSDAVVVRETDRAGGDAGALAAEQAAPQIEREGGCGDRLRGADRRGACQRRTLFVVGRLGQFGAAAELFGQTDRVQIGNILPSVAAPDDEFGKDHKRVLYRSCPQ